jgi:hypothetical protein
MHERPVRVDDAMAFTGEPEFRGFLKKDLTVNAFPPTFFPPSKRDMHPPTMVEFSRPKVAVFEFEFLSWQFQSDGIPIHDPASVGRIITRRQSN